MTKSVALPIEEQTKGEPLRQLVCALWGGTIAMRKAGATYLPQEPGEEDARYQNRLKRSILSNYYRWTVTRLVGKVFRQPIVVHDDVPGQVKTLLDDVDNSGTNIDMFARTILECAINDGVTFVLVDFPRTMAKGDQPRTLAQDKAQNVRPYAVHIKCCDVLGWKYATINGQPTLLQFRFRQCVEEDDPSDEFKTIKRHRVCVYEIGRVRIYEEREQPDKTKAWVLVEEYTTTSGVVPVLALYTHQTGFMTGEPMLLDLAYLNIAHWQSDSDQRNLLHTARVPILFASGLGDTDDAEQSFELRLGSGSLVRGPQGSTLEYVEHTGKALESGAKDLEVLEQRMAVIGMDAMTRQPGNVTATARALDQTEQSSPLQVVAQQLEQCIEGILDLFGQWLELGMDSGGSVTVHKDFGISQRDAEDVKNLITMRAAGDISRQTFWEELKRRGLLRDEFEGATEMELIELESAGLTSEELALYNLIGDITKVADGHVHTLEEGGWTNDVEGHRHQWTRDGEVTTVADGHSHGLKPRSARHEDEETSVPASRKTPADDEGVDEDA